MRLVFISILISILPIAHSTAAPRVIADIAPVHGLVARVMMGIGTPVLLVEPGASAHDFSLSPSSTKALAQAVAVFWVGEPLTPWLKRPIENVAKNAKSVELLSLSEKFLLPARTSQKHAHNHQHGHSLEDFDAHAWLDPKIASYWLKIIAESLSVIDPKNSAKYRENADVGQLQIETGLMELSKQLVPLKDMPVAAYHDAYQYLEHRFNLKFLGAIADGDATPPSARRVAELRKRINQYEAFCILTEPQYPSQLIQSISSRNHVRHGIIDPLGKDIPIGPGFYTAFLKSIGNSLSSCM
jgi:zinc transport system substrate-binding protein